MDHRVRFDRFQFDTMTARLWAGDQEVRLTPKAANVLGVLVAHAGEPVTKDTLFATVWPDTVVTDDSLTTCIAELRRAFNDDAKQTLTTATGAKVTWVYVTDPEGNVIELQSWSK
jgi:DNA-binding winged helix-turn-helix (wHTH) protein